MGSVIPRKRLFVGLLAGSLGVVALAMGFVWYLTEHRMYTYQRTILVLGAMLALAVILLVAIGVGGLVLMLWKGRTFSVVNNVSNVAVNLLFPVTVQVGRLLGISEDRIKSSFIEVNNQLVVIRKIKLEPEEILVLAPHCLQYNGCPFKVTRDIRNCRKCGRCQIREFLWLRDEYGVNVAVVTGGTLARRYVREFRPKAVIAIACERDLTSGILDSYPLPVFGILNERPNGPCQDTRVRLDSVSEAILRFSERRKL